MHDLIKDPPFSRLDLVSCRNVLIYFEPQLQQRVIATFHYALKPQGYLFLGPSESALQTQLFAPLDQHYRLYARSDTAAKLPAISSWRGLPEAPPHGAAPQAAGDIDRRVARVVAQYAPAFLVINDHHDILRFSGDTAKFLQPATGIASLHLFALLHPDLRSVMRAALREATATGKKVVNQGLSFEVGDRYDKVSLIVEPLSGRDFELFVVVFQEAPGIVSTHQGSAPADVTTTEVLNRELLTTRERLRNLTQELEAANEELQSSNEEYLSVNEELQSAIEELETSKEELQSLNEELQTVNVELNIRNESLLQTNSDLANLFDSTSVAMLFLDRDMRIRRFTPKLLELFRLREGDEGRPISDIVTHLTQGGLRNDAEEVFKTLVPREREVTVTEGVSFLMQVRPYRDLNHVIDGVVVTFVDLTERKKHEEARAQLAAIVDSSQDAIVGHDLNGTVISWNNGATALFGTPTNEAMGYSMPTLVKNVLPWEWQDMLAKLHAGEQLSNFECSGTTKDGQPIEVSITISPVKEGDGQLTGISLVARDIRARKVAEQKAAMLLGELDHRVKNILSIVLAIISQTLRTSATNEDFVVQVEGRIRAIAKAHSLLTNAGAGEISLHAILETELAAFDSGGDKVVARGPNIALAPKAGLALAMAVHELASNAAKYGALSTPTGRLVIEWSVTGDADAPSMTFTWAEMGGPAVSPPTRRGFGTTMIERALTHELDAEVIRDFAATGLRCTIIIPLTTEFGRLLPKNGQTVS